MVEAELQEAFVPALYKPAALLPIAKHRESLLYLIETHAVTIVVGQTGSGKTTQIPQFLEQAGWCADSKTIAVTQPRRVAATTVAIRVAEEMGCKLGAEVGYSIRFEDVTSPTTRIKFLTDGMLLREALVDPLLSRYSVIMVDEAHERSLSTDILLGVLQKILKKRTTDLRIIISSATLQAQDFLDFFTRGQEPAKTATASGAVTLDELIKHGAADAAATESVITGQIISLEGRMYPVDILYLETPAEDYVLRAVDTAFDIHVKEPDGDILVFLTGREEIERCVQAISERAANLHPRAATILPLPIYAGLPADQQMAVFEPAPDNTRKVIFATNIAEASLTIDGILYVVDSGFVKLRAFDPMTNIETLTAVPISKASATQRAGRAGRTRPGKCFRLYTEAAYTALEASLPPEIQRSDLAPIILQLKALGIDNIARFSFLTPPPAELIARALELLFTLGALDSYAKLTMPHGLRMAELALDPMMSSCLLSAARFDCVSEMLSIAAMVALEGAVFLLPADSKKAADSAKRKFTAVEGDHLTLLNLYTAFQAQGRKSHARGGPHADDAHPTQARWCHEHFLNHKSLQRAVAIRRQLARALERFGMNVPTAAPSTLAKTTTTPSSPSSTAANQEHDKTTAILRCLTTGFFAHAAKQHAGGDDGSTAGSTFRAAGGPPDLVLHAHPTSVWFNRGIGNAGGAASVSGPQQHQQPHQPQWVIFGGVTEMRGRTYIRDVSRIERRWLEEYAHGFYTFAG